MPPSSLRDYPVTIAYSEGDGEYVATTPGFPHISALAETAEDALTEFHAALSGVLECLAESGLEPPAPL